MHNQERCHKAEPQEAFDTRANDCAVLVVPRGDVFQTQHEMAPSAELTAAIPDFTKIQASQPSLAVRKLSFVVNRFGDRFSSQYALLSKTVDFDLQIIASGTIEPLHLFLTYLTCTRFVAQFLPFVRPYFVQDHCKRKSIKTWRRSA